MRATISLGSGARAFLATKATIQDVAREAGVSAATVDRVLNGRPGVRQVTVERVEDAVRRLNYEPDRLTGHLTRDRDYTFVFVLPTGTNAFMRALHQELENLHRRLLRERIRVQIDNVDVFDGMVLGTHLEGLATQDIDGVAVVALEHPAVREAIATLNESSIPVLTLVSDIPNSQRRHFVGIDNSAAGRTAGSLVGRFSGGRPGSVGLLVGSMALRDHVERAYGFEQVIGSEYRNLTVLPVRETRDSIDQVHREVIDFHRTHPDLLAIYNAGGGSRGLISGLESDPAYASTIAIGHELTDSVRKALVRGTLDAAINQDPGHEIRSAIRVLTSFVDDTDVIPGQERIRIDVYLRDNIP